jgi:hypothetical protein
MPKSLLKNLPEKMYLRYFHMRMHVRNIRIYILSDLNFKNLNAYLTFKIISSSNHWSVYSVKKKNKVLLDKIVLLLLPPPPPPEKIPARDMATESNSSNSCTHCEKSVFALAYRQKIPVLRKENPADNTRTICLPPIEFFKITHARKATARKSWPETTDTAGKSRLSGLWRETFYIPLTEKVTPENPGK